MATQKQMETFISQIAPIIVNEARSRGYNYPSAMIAQAIHESGVTSKLATKYHNYWGMKCGSSYKGGSVNLRTTEYYNDVATRINDNFRAFDSMEEGVKGYFDFIQMKRYQNVKSAINAYNYLERIYDSGWATGPRASYLSKCQYYIEQFNLTQYDSPRAESTVIGTFRITATKGLRIRSNPSVLSDQVGSLSYNTVIAPTEQKMLPDGSIWVRINKGWCCRRLQGQEYMIQFS